MLFCKKLIVRFFRILNQWNKEYESILVLKSIDAGENVRFGVNSFVKGNIKIGSNTYINGYARIVSGNYSNVTIGENCAIGRFFSCAARTHDLRRPTPTANFTSHLQREDSISIGNSVWIGDHVTIREGITIEDFAVIGANSVVLKDVKKFEIVGGVPAKHIRFNTINFLYNENIN